MTDRKTRELTRRNVLAAIGGVGAVSAGAGIGTTAYFSDQETFEDNTLTAGELDLRLDWQQLYWGMPYDHDRAPYGSAGRPFVNAHPDHDEDGMQSLDDETRYVDGHPGDDASWSAADVELGANIQEALTCDSLENFGAPDSFHNDTGYDPDSLIHLDDVKPGDCGEVTFSYHLCDNPGYVWMLANLAEGGDDQLAEAIQARVWYDLDCNNVFDEAQNRLIFQWGSLAELLSSLQNGIQLDPGAYDRGDGESDGGDGDDSECVKVGKVDDLDEDGIFRGVDGGSTTATENEFVFDEAAGAPPWSAGGDYHDHDVTVAVEITDTKDDDDGEPIAFKATVTDGEYGLCRIRVNGGQDSETFYDLGEGEGGCVTETKELETNLRNPNNDRQVAISNVEFFVCESDDDVPPPGRCFPADETFCLGFEWCFPVDAGEIDGVDDVNDLQERSIGFDLGFYTEQCRHNDGSGPVP